METQIDSFPFGSSESPASQSQTTAVIGGLGGVDEARMWVKDTLWWTRELMPAEI